MPSHFSRRSVLKAASVLAAPLVVPARALGLDGNVPPSERILLGGIGIGGRGSYDLGVMLHEKDAQFLAVTEVSQARRDAVKKMVDGHYGNASCAQYRDFREMLAQRPDLDAVLIATGDRWHTIASIAAMAAGKDVFCEKPSTMTIAEGQALVGAARRFGRIFQTGTQRLSEHKFVFADQLARTGRLGKVHTVYAHILPFFMHTTWLAAEPEPDPSVFDWDLWLGPAPWRPYNKRYTNGCGAWLDYYDFGTGVAGWGSHTICQCQSGIGMLDTCPVTYQYPKKDNADGLTCVFANGVRMVLDAQGWPQEGKPGRWRGSCGVRYEGSEGWVAVADGYTTPDVSNPAYMGDFNKLVNEYIEQTGRPMHHIRDFLNCVRSRRSTIASDVVAHRTMSTNHAANICMLLKRDMTYDPVKEEFVNDVEANRMRGRALRGPWRV